MFTVLLLPLPHGRIDGETGQPCWSGGEQSWAQSAMDRWIDADNIDQYFWSHFINIINPSVKDFLSFFLIVSTINHKNII
jgi:hypothetical protein